MEAFLRWFEGTHLQEQLMDFDAIALFGNPWFLVPFAALIGYLLYKKNFRDIVILTAIIGVWWVSGTEYMQTLVVDDTLQINKILPVLFGGAAIIGLVVYLLISRSD